MAQGDFTPFDSIKERLALGSANFETDSLKLMLVSGYSLDQTHVGYGEVSGYECSGAGYTAGGVELSGLAVTLDSTHHQMRFDATDPSWTALNVGTPSHAILYDSTLSGLNLVGAWELGVASNGGDYGLTFSASGAFYLG